MDDNNRPAAQGQVQMAGQVIGGESVPAGGIEGGDWRTQLQQDSRERIVNKIMETLKRHLPFAGQEGLQELKMIAVRFEEKIYTAATSQSDYLRKVSLKMLSMETKSQNPMANPLQSNAASNSGNPQDPASLDSSSQKGSSTEGDWREDIYQKIKSMHEMYYPELNEMYQRMAAKLQQHDAHPQQPKNEQFEKLRFLKLMLERLIMFLRTNKNDIQPNHKDKIVGVEKQIVNILNSNRPRKSVSSLQQGQLALPHMHAMQQSQQQQPQMHSNEGSSVLNSRQNMLEGIQSGSNMDAAQGTMPSGSVPVQKPDVQNMYNATPFAPMMQGWPTNSVFPFGQIQGGQQQIMPQSFIPQLNLQELMQQQGLGLQQQSNTLPNSVVCDQSQVQQQLLPPNIQNNNASTVVLNSAGLTPSTTQSHMQPQQKQYLWQPNQPLPQPLMSLNQLQPWQLQQQLYLQQQANILPKDWQQSLVLQPQSTSDQQKQSFQFHSQSETGTNSKSKKKTVTALKKTHTMQQPQMPLNEGQVNSQTQSMNIQSSMVMPTQQHNALSSDSSVPNSRPNMLFGELQSGSNIDPGQSSNVLNQTQQVATNSLQQNLVGGSQPLTRSISSQNESTALQSKASSLQSNSNAVQPQQINPLLQMFLREQKMQQQYQQAHMQQILLQHQQEQQIMHQLIQQHNALSSDSSVPNSRPNMLGELQAGSNIDPGQSIVLNQTQQVATNSLQQKLLTRSISSQNEPTALQSKACSLQSKSNAVQPQQINPLQQMFLSQQKMQQQYQQAHIQEILLQHQQEQQIMHQLIQQKLMQHLVQNQQQQQQTLQKQSAQQLIQQRQQPSRKQSEQQLIQKQPPAPQQQQQTSQKQSAQHVIQMPEKTFVKSSAQQMARITAFLKLVCHVLIVVLLVMLMIKIGGMFLTQSFTGSYYDA